jgi:6-pyruvoyltetrahydropterin/6-carboxytetrahydropterin synthase
MTEFAVTRAYHFSAAHQLSNPSLSDEENADLYGQCFRQHGHNYGLEVTVAGTLDPATGMSIDIGVIDATVKRAVLDRVDHYDLSAAVPALAGVITTGENLARAFWGWLESALPAGILRRVTVVETANNVFEYCGEPARGR